MTGSRHPLGWVAPEVAAPIATPEVSPPLSGTMTTVPLPTQVDVFTFVASPGPDVVNVGQLPLWAQAYIGELEERALALEQELAALKARFAP